MNDYSSSSPLNVSAHLAYLLCKRHLHHSCGFSYITPMVSKNKLSYI